MNWFDASVMAKKGVARGKPGESHRIGIEDQGTFHYVYGPYVKPVLEVNPGAVVTVETHDAFEGKITSETDRPSEILNFPFLNPQTGPIFVRGAEKGDCLAVRIISIKPRGPQPVGTTCLLQEFGGLVATGQTAMLNAPLPERVKKVRLDEDGVYWSDKITLPYEPFIGTIGTSPEIEAISSLVPDYYGGNMDLPDVGPGAIIYLPVNTVGVKAILKLMKDKDLSDDDAYRELRVASMTKRISIEEFAAEIVAASTSSMRLANKATHERKTKQP